MPLYEYRCQSCRRRFTVLVRSFDPPQAPPCDRCQSTDTRRLVARVALLRSEEARMDALAEGGLPGDVDERDPASLGRWMRRMGHEMGEDLGPEFDEMVGRLEAGESPEAIEAALPELGGPDSPASAEDMG